MGVYFGAELFYGYPFNDEEIFEIKQEHDDWDGLEDAYLEIKVPRNNYDFEYVPADSYGYTVTNEGERDRYFQDRALAKETLKPVQFGLSGYFDGDSFPYLHVNEYNSYQGECVPIDIVDFEPRSRDILKIATLVHELGLQWEPVRIGWYLSSSYGV